MASSLLILHVLALMTLVASQSDPEVQLHHGGIIRGRRDNRLNIDLTPDPNIFLDAFQGIPYGQALARFSPPTPHPGWEGVRSGQEPAPECVQFNNEGHFVGVEDCLNLNVYNPYSESATLLPVMVYVHGGSFERFSSAREYFGPDYFYRHIETPVVIVAVNYRLGIFGFLSLEDELVPGNNGLRDMIEALRWVQLNIRAFGGDPDRVTLFGQSAGAASVSLLALSPETRGLFHAVLTQSGSSLNPWALTPPGKARETADTLAGVIGCTGNISTYDCLIQAPTKVLALSIYSKEVSPWNTLPFPFTPVIDGDTSLNPVIPLHPTEVLTNGLFEPLPWVMGVTKEEAFYLSTYISGQDDLDQLQTDFFPLACPTGYWINERTSSDPEGGCLKVFERYLKNQTITSMETARGFFEALRDRMFINGVLQQAMMASLYTDVWVYSFQFKGKASYMEQALEMQNRLPDAYFFNVTAHCDDMYYLWSIPAFDPEFSNVSPEAEMIEIMTREWTSFGTAHELLGPQWKKWNPDTWLQARNYTYPDTSDQVLFDMDVFQFWDQILDQDPTTKAFQTFIEKQSLLRMRLND